MNLRLAKRYPIASLLITILILSISVPHVFGTAAPNMTKIGDLTTEANISLPGASGPGYIEFGISNISVLSFVPSTSRIYINGQYVYIQDYIDEFISALESGGARLTITIYTDGITLPTTSDSWTRAEIKGSFSMNGFSCNVSFSTVAHLKPGFDKSIFAIAVDPMDKAGVGTEEGIISNVNSTDQTLSKVAQSMTTSIMMTSVQGGVVIDEATGTLRGTSSAYIQEDTPPRKYPEEKIKIE